MMNVKEFYRSINGNYEAAISIMINDAFVERMLSKFFTNNNYNDIISSYENKDFKALFAAIHSFKGVVGNLALTPLFDLSVIITEETRSGEYKNIDKEINELKEKYSFISNEYLKYSGK